MMTKSALERRGGLEGVKRHGCRVGTHALGHHVDPDAFAPHLQLVHGRRAKRVGRTKHHLQSLLLVTVREFGDRGRLAHAIHAHHHDDMGPCVCRHLVGIGCVQRRLVVLGEQADHLLAQHRHELLLVDVRLPCGTLLQSTEDGLRGVNAHVRQDERLLQIVHQVFVDATVAREHLGNAIHDGLLRLGQALVERLLLFLAKKPLEESHAARFQ